ncbi:MAG: hypothetical protein V1813_03555 [Candidatus Aenigmatarchaeota archaeon]
MGVPTQRVLSLSSQGMSEPEILKTLRQEGYAPLEVDRAMKDAMRSGAGQAQGQPRMAPQPGYQQAAPYQRPMPPAPQGQQPFGGYEQQQQFGGKNKYAPTDWDAEDDLPDDDLDMDDVPKDKRLGPGAMFSELDDEKLPPPPGARGDMQPLRFAEAPLPKERDERDREVKDRRRREVEELVEQIAEEKWQDMARRVHDVEEKAEKLSSDLKNAPARTPGGAAPEELSSLKNDISTIRQSVEETNARIDSLEEVVKGSLSPMIDSIRKLRGAAPSAAPERLERPPARLPQQAPESSYAIPRYAPKSDEDE